MPYVRLTPARRPWKRVTLWVGAVSVYALTAMAMVWDARHLLLQAGGLLLAVAAGLFAVTRIGHSGACVGLHCSGCRR